jgi:hypothetical protein
MAVGNVIIKQVLMRRGNTASASAYTGPVGELIVDTGLDTLRLQDGVTVGGHILATNNQISTLSNTVANLTVLASGNYGNANVAAYLPTNSTIIALTANAASQAGDITTLYANASAQANSLTGANAAIVTANTGMKSYVDSVTTAWTANAASQQALISTINANVTAANAAIVTANTALKSYTDTAISTAINNLIASAPGTLDTLNEIAANLASEASAIGAITNSITAANTAIVTANTAMKGYVDAQTSAVTTAWTANAAAQSNQLTGANAAIVTANTAMKGYVDAVTTAWTANAGTQQTVINTLQANVGSFYTYANLNYGTSSYANANVAAYLTTYAGNIALGNITHTNGSNAFNITVSGGPNNSTWNFDRGGQLTMPGGWSTPTLNLGQLSNTVQLWAVSNNSLQLQTDGGNKSWTFGTDGNLSYPDGTKTNGNTAYSVNTTTGSLNAFKWKFSDSTVGSDTITLQWNLLDTKQSQWLLSTNNQGKQWTLDSAAQTIGFANVGDTVRGTVTFGTATNGGTGNVNDIELTSLNGNAYITTSDGAWNFDSTGNLTMPWHGNKHDGHIFNVRGLHALGASTAASIDGFTSISAGNIVATSGNGGNGTVYANGYYWANGVSILSGLTANLSFVGDTIYDLNGPSLVNGDLSHGSTSSVLLPRNGASTAAHIINTYGAVSVTTGTDPVDTQSWDFNSDGTITLPGSSGYIGRAGYTNGIDLYNNSGGAGYVRMNYADSAVLWADPAGSHLATAGGSLLLDNDGNVTITGSILFSGSPGGIISGPDTITTSNIVVGNQIKFGDGSIQTTAYTGGGSSYGNSNVAAYLTANPQSGTYSNVNVAAYISANPVGTTYSNANVVSMLSANTAVFIGNANPYTTQSNITQLFVGGNTVITSGGGASPGATQILNNAYWNNAGVLTARNTYNGGAMQIVIDGASLSISAQGSTTANTATGMGTRLTLNSTTLSTSNSVGITSAGTLTASGTLAVNGSGGITTTQTTIPLFNGTATTINFGGAATALNMGAATGSVTAAGNLFAGNNLGTSTGNLSVRAQGNWNTLTLYNIAGGYNSPPYTNQALTGGSGTGMTANYSSVGGYISTITVNNPGTGYKNGDILTVPNGLGTTVILSNYNSAVAGTIGGAANFTFTMDGSLILPGNVTHATNSAIFGDFTNSTVNYRTIFRPTAANSNPGIYTAPTGTGTSASWQAANSSDLTNTSKILIAAGASDVQLVSGINGTGTYLPLSFLTNGTTQMQLGTAGNLNMVTGGNIATAGNVIAGNYLFSNGVSILSTVSAGSYGNTQVAAYLPTYSGNVGAGNIVTTGATSGNISGANYISANAFQVSTGIFWANGTAWSSAGGSSSSISNGASSLTFASSGGNGVFQIGGVQTATFSQSTISMIGNISATANIIATNLIGTQYGNTIGTTATYSGNLTAANINANQFGNSVGTTATYSGNITAANIVTTGTYGNITNANVIFANTVVVGGVSLTRATNGYNNWKGNTYANIDNISCSVFSNGMPALSSVSGTLNYFWSATSVMSGHAIIGNTNTGGSATTIPQSFGLPWTLASGGDTVTAVIQDQGLSRVYNVTYMQTVGTGNCAIVAERIL